MYSDKTMPYHVIHRRRAQAIYLHHDLRISVYMMYRILPMSAPGAVDVHVQGQPCLLFQLCPHLIFQLGMAQLSV